MFDSYVPIHPEEMCDRVDLRPGMHVADLGCGRSGMLAFTAARRVGEEGIVYAVDVVPDVLEHISSQIRSRGHDNIQVIWSDIELYGKTAIPQQSLDRCFFQNVLSVLSAEDQALAEAARLLRPGGSLVVVDWVRPIGAGSTIPSRLVLPSDVDRHAQQLGLLQGERFSLGGYHYGYILKKPE